jgi:hypothetical protein
MNDEFRARASLFGISNLRMFTEHKPRPDRQDFSRDGHAVYDTNSHHSRSSPHTEDDMIYFIVEVGEERCARKTLKSLAS